MMYKACRRGAVVLAIAFVAVIGGIAEPGFSDSRQEMGAGSVAWAAEHIQHRVIVGTAGSRGYCYDWGTNEGVFGPGCWHNDELASPNNYGLDVSGADVVVGVDVYHQEYGISGSLNVSISAINRCGPFDTGNFCSTGSGCSLVNVQMRDSTSAIAGEIHYFHIVPTSSLAVGPLGGAGTGWWASIPALGKVAATQASNCTFTGAHLHQSADNSIAGGSVNFNWAIPPGDPPSQCGGDLRPTFLCLSPFGDYTSRWLYKIDRVIFP